MYQRWLEAFHGAARTGSFTAAAKQLGVSQPTISSHIKSLEDVFRVELFYRNGRTVSLTPIGQSLLNITHGIFGQADEAVALLRSAGIHEVGELRIGAIRPSEAIEILSDFHARHPGVALQVTLGSTPSILSDLLRFECDIAIVGLEPADMRFHCLPYDRHRVVAVVGSRHPLARRRSLRLRNLEGEKMIVRSKGSTTREVFDAALAEAGVKIRPVMVTNSREALLRAVANGVGIGVITESEYVAMAGIKAILIEQPRMYTFAYVVCLSERRTRPLISAFLETAAGKARPWLGGH